MDSTSHKKQQLENTIYNEALIIGELERRYYLYLIGGEYEKLFYSFEGKDEQSIGENSLHGMSRIRLEVEVSQSERRKQIQGNCADPDYKGVLDYILKNRINSKLEKEDLFSQFQELRDIQPVWQSFGDHDTFSNELLVEIENVKWLQNAAQSFFSQPTTQGLLGTSANNTFKQNMQIIGYPLFIWLMPRWCGDRLFARLNESLQPIMNRLRHFSRLTSGAIACIALDQDFNKNDKWMLYTLANINILPLTIIINIVNNEIERLIEQQTTSLLTDSDGNAAKLEVISSFQFSGDELREILTTDELLKPYILDEFGFKNFDPLPYLMGYSEDEQIANIFFQARAYAMYRQLFKTGRIHPHETAIFLKKNKINKTLLHKLNSMDLSKLRTHIDLHYKLMDI